MTGPRSNLGSTSSGPLKVCGYGGVGGAHERVALGSRRTVVLSCCDWREELGSVGFGELMSTGADWLCVGSVEALIVVGLCVSTQHPLLPGLH